MPMVVKSAKRQTILHVYAFCEKEKAENKLIVPLQQVRARVAAITDVSECTVTRILRQERETSSVSNLDVPGPSKVTTPGKKRPNRVNPIELVWSVVKRRFAEKNVGQRDDQVESLIKEAFGSISNEIWKKECSHVIKIEDEYIVKDKIIDEGSDRFLLWVGSDSDESDSDSENSSTTEEDMIPLHLIDHNY